MKTICLNMIVKNESKAIRNLLASVKKIIDYWVIVDTGSTDGTQKIIKEIMNDVPGELHERPWVHFAHNRNEALDIARDKADYILILDADHRLVVLSSFDKESLWQEFYLLKLTSPGSDHYRPLLINNDPTWIWEGVIHETMISSRKMQGEVLKDLYVDCSAMNGWRSQDPKKYYRDAEILQKALEEDPWNSRYVFYLAESYDRVHEYELALKNYIKRAEMEGEPAETFWTLFCIGCLQEKLEMDSETVLSSYCKAYEFDSTRAEPLHRLAIYVMKIKCVSLGYVIAKFAMNLKTPNVLNTNYYPWVYEWGLLGVAADCASAMRNFAEARELYQQVLKCKGVPLELKKQIEANIKRFPRETLDKSLSNKVHYGDFGNQSCH
jgi:glycosyltransferase involved in cell wall biosynthesis